LLDLRRDAFGGQANATLTRTRQQMAESRAWRRRPDLDPWRALDCEYFICSRRRLAASGCVHLIILTRSSRERPFDELDRRTVALLHSELHRLWRHADDAGQGLPPRLQQTLELLLEGLSEAEIVTRLGLSPHTVHDHVKRLYRRFQVNSRAQLLAHPSHTSFTRAPRLSVNLLESEADERSESLAPAALRPGATHLRTPLSPGARVPQR
jgi:DNA-binding CsgD family transcriptional regulator